MNRFRYKYKGVLYDSTVETYLQDGNHQYRVSLPDGLQYVIAPMGIRSPNGKIIWLQSNKEGEIVQPHDLNQAIGEGLEEFKLNFSDF